MTAPRIHRRLLIVLAAVAAPSFLLALCPLQARMDAQRSAVLTAPDELLLRSGPLLKRLSLGYSSLLADIYWTRTVQYYGTKLAHQDTDLSLLPPLLDLTTWLDPHLIIVYRYGAIYLAEPPPVGAGRPDDAASLLRRGIAANPDEWQLWASLAFVHYLYRKDFPAASHAYLEGAKIIPGAPEWMRGMAAKIESEGGSRETSRFLWTQLYESSQDPKVRKNALAHLQGLKAEDAAVELRPRVLEFNRRFGHFPASFHDLVRAGLLPGLPLDPAGYPYALGPRGEIQLDSSSPVASEIIPRRPPQ
jgi:hypothetical protein